MDREKEKVWATLKEPSGLEISEKYGDFYGDFIPIQEFAEDVRTGCFIDYDGFGYWATASKFSRDRSILPSQFSRLIRPTWATHVLWFNR